MRNVKVSVGGRMEKEGLRRCGPVCSSRTSDAALSRVSPALHDAVEPLDHFLFSGWRTLQQSDLESYSVINDFFFSASGIFRSDGFRSPRTAPGQSSWAISSCGYSNCALKRCNPSLLQTASGLSAEYFRSPDFQSLFGASSRVFLACTAIRGKPAARDE